MRFTCVARSVAEVWSRVVASTVAIDVVRQCYRTWGEDGKSVEWVCEEIAWRTTMSVKFCSLGTGLEAWVSVDCFD